MVNSMMKRLGLSAVTAVAVVAAVVAIAQTRKAPAGAHMEIADPAALSGDRAEAVYQAIRYQVAQNYRASGDPVVTEYQTWQRYNTAPYRSSLHGERFVNNYANPLASRYARFEKLGAMPPGAMVAKDSFTVTEAGQVQTGPFFLMEKKAPGFDPAGGDWLFMMIRPDGGLVGMTGGRGSKNVKFCAECHNKAPAGQDHLYLLPREVRR